MPVANLWIIDDDPMSTFYIKRMCEISCPSITVTVFHDATSALSFLIENLSYPECVPDIIFLDIYMPVASGWDFMESLHEILRSLQKRVTVCLLTTSLNKKDIERARRFTEIKEYIVKPLTLAKMRSLIAEHE